MVTLCISLCENGMEERGEEATGLGSSNRKERDSESSKSGISLVKVLCRRPVDEEGSPSEWPGGSNMREKLEGEREEVLRV